ncbi:MAG: DUF5011 domain-containing protein, partial [Bacteroidia bacterium]|nr:DUF5011 domain-containing protein [Bacteroidia bacterium]
LHTADDAGSAGPDTVYGWGLLNGKRAAETISSNGNESIVDELTLSPGQTYQINVDSDGVSNLLASISWTDPAGTATSATNSNTPVLVNDLDIRISQGGTTYNPWRLTGVNSNGLGDNNVDPFERAEVSNASGSYTITVTHKGSLSGGSQNYTLIVTGLSSTPVVCNATVPTGLSIDGFGDTTANVSWDAVPGASYSVRYREVGTSTWTTNSVSGTSTVLNGLSPLTQYEVQVRSECPDTSTSSYSNSETFTTLDVQLNYCSSASTNINDEYIGRVQLNTIDNVSGGQFYTDFTSVSTTLTKGTQYTITVTPTWTGTIYAEGYSVWIDYNRDGDFTDAGEQVWTQSATTATPVSGNFTVPSSAVENSTRMRVSMKYNGIPTSCETFTYGEVEDYTVVLQGSGPDVTPPVITLIGASTINLNLGDTYTEQGATATDNVDGDISANVVIGGDTVDTNTAGTYIVTYNVSDAAGNAATQVSRTVNVAADTTPPVITLIGASTINLNLGDTYTEQGATATDNVDGDISANIVIGGDVVDTNTAGTYIVTYNVSDAAGNAATQVSRTVNVAADTTPPVINLIGASTINLTVGDSYTDQGATATDNVDGDITANIVVGGDTVDTNTAGTYVITYNVSDAAGNAATQVTRTVNVSEPSSGCSGGISSYPYTESFENTLGAWTQSTADDINWTVDSGGTPSSGTGPSSGSAGSYYIYVEASGNGTGYPNKQAIINSPCFDLGGLSNPSFDFDYHMNGSTDMGTIDLEVSTDEGLNWTSLWNQSGNQGNSWLSASIDLSPYAGSAIQLRFNRVTGGTWQADIAIDNINLSEPAPPTCSDGQQNGDETGVDCGGSVCPPCSSGSEIIHQGFFETGWDGWQDGGSDCFRYSGSRSFEGSYSIRIRDNSGTGSAMTLSNVDVSSYDQVEIEFFFYPNSMENGEDFWVRFYNGSSWTTVASYAAGTSFSNGSFYTATVTLDAAQYNFASNSGFRFQCDASGNNDQIYIDQVTITGITGGTQSDDTITALGGGYFTTSDELTGAEEDFLLYPNPVKGKFLSVKLPDNAEASFRILNMIGQTVRTGMIANDQVSVDGLDAGVYFIEVNDGDEVMTKRFIRQ